MAKKTEKTAEGDAKDGDGEKKGRVKRTATTMYFKPEVFAAFKKRVVDEPVHGYEIVEQCIEAFLAIDSAILAGLEKARKAEKRKAYEIVEDALAAYLKKAKMI